MSKWKWPPDIKMPDFQSTAEKAMDRFAQKAEQKPDSLMAKAYSKVNEYKQLMEDPDIEKIQALTEKLGNSGKASTISKVANALGINISEDQIKKVLDKKSELEQAAAEKTIDGITNFMAKEGYPIKMDANDLATKLTKADDPVDVLKEAAQPFVDLATDTAKGEHKIEVERLIGRQVNIDESIKSEITRRGEGLKTEMVGRADEYFENIFGDLHNN